MIPNPLHFLKRGRPSNKHLPSSALESKKNAVCLCPPVGNGLLGDGLEPPSTRSLSGNCHTLGSTDVCSGLRQLSLSNKTPPSRIPLCITTTKHGSKYKKKRNFASSVASAQTVLDWTEREISDGRDYVLRSYHRPIPFNYSHPS